MLEYEVICFLKILPVSGGFSVVFSPDIFFNFAMNFLLLFKRSMNTTFAIFSSSGPVTGNTPGITQEDLAQVYPCSISRFSLRVLILISTLVIPVMPFVYNFLTAFGLSQSHLPIHLAVTLILAPLVLLAFYILQ